MSKEKEGTTDKQFQACLKGIKDYGENEKIMNMYRDTLGFKLGWNEALQEAEELTWEQDIKGFKCKICKRKQFMEYINDDLQKTEICYRCKFEALRRKTE